MNQSSFEKPLFVRTLLDSVLDSHLYYDSEKWCFDLTKAEALKIGLSEEQYLKILEDVGKSNKILEQLHLEGVEVCVAEKINEKTILPTTKAEFYGYATLSYLSPSQMVFFIGPKCVNAMVTSETSWVINFNGRYQIGPAGMSVVSLCNSDYTSGYGSYAWTVYLSALGMTMSEYYTVYFF